MNAFRLCFVGPAASVTFRRWADWFVVRGHEVTVLTVEPCEESPALFRQYDLSCRRSPRKAGRVLSAIRLATKVRQLGPDLVHVHYLRGLAWGLVLRRIHPCVVTPWGSDVLEEQGAFREWYARPLTRALLRRADVVTAHSGYMAARVHALSSRPIERIGWGVDLTRFRLGLRETPEARALRRRWSLPDRQVILSPRLAQPFYNHHRLIQALPMVREKAPDAVAVIPEYCPDIDYARKLRRLADEMGMADHVRFPGSIPHQDMPLWLNIADVVVMLPESDGMPNSLLEAMACGAVPVLNRLPQYTELVNHGRNGLFVDPDGDLVGALVGALTDAELRRHIGGRNRALVEECADQDQEMRRMERIYRTLISRAAAGPARKGS
jgi:glycosyltransferase involved in cell wall biosynthesis